MKGRMFVAKLKGGKAGSIKALKSKLKKGSGGDQFLTRVPSEGSLILRFLSEPEEWVEYFEHFERDRNGSWSFPCIENCPESHEGDDKPKKRYLAPAVDTQENKVVPVQLPVSAVSALVKKYEKHGTIMDRDYEISKSGTGFDTEYDVDAEAPTRMNLKRFDIPDLEAILQSQLETSDDEDDEDDKPKSKKGTKKTRRAPIDTDDDDDVDDDEDDDDEDDDEDDSPPPRKSVKRKVAKKAAAPTKSKTGPSKSPAKKSARKIVKKK